MKCENCETEHEGTYGSGRFCSSKCARGYSTKEKRSLINVKVSKTILDKGDDKFIICPICEKNINVRYVKNKKTCSAECSIINRSQNLEYREKLSIAGKMRMTEEEKNRLREIGRKGGFGKKGFTKHGIKFDSTLEQKCFEYLEELNIVFEPHKNIPNSSKVSDIFLITKNIWIELDGINREKKKKWLGKNYDYWIEKLEIYKNNNLELKIIYSFQEFDKYITEIFGSLAQ